MNKDEIQLLTFQWIFVCQIYHLFYFLFFFGLRCVCRFPAMLGIKRTSYHLQVENPRNKFPVGHGNIIRAFEEGLANSIQELIDGLPNHDRIQIYLGSNRLRNSHTSANVSVEQWHDPLGAFRQVLQNISNC